MKSTIALIFSMLALCLSAYGLLRPDQRPPPEPAPTFDSPWSIPIDDWDVPRFPDAWMPSAWNPEDR